MEVCSLMPIAAVSLSTVIWGISQSFRPFRLANKAFHDLIKKREDETKKGFNEILIAL